MRQLVILGCGGVGKCALYYAASFLGLDYNSITVVDKQRLPLQFPAVQECVAKGARYIQFCITANNIQKLLTDIIKCAPGDIIIDLTTRTDTNNFMIAAAKHQLHYINTSIEQSDISDLSDVDTIYTQHAKVRDAYQRVKHQTSSTCIVEFGMNPGLISTFVKQGILDIAKHKLKHHYNKTLEQLIAKKRYRELGELLKIRTIHCSEIDTQRYTSHRSEAFLNTWSCVGLIDEAYEQAEMSLGTHEKNIPFRRTDVTEIVPGFITVAKQSARTFFRSYIPIQKADGIAFREIKGAAIHHGEAVSLHRYLATDTWVPTIHYVYKMSPQTAKVVNDTDDTDMLKISKNVRKWKVLNMYDDKLDGTDNVGATFFLEDDPVTGKKNAAPWAYWIGTMLDTDYTLNTLKDPYFGPTTIQVVAGVLSAAAYAIKHPNKGLLFPEDLPESFVLRKARKYLGTIFSGEITGCKIRGANMKDLYVRR